MLLLIVEDDDRVARFLVRGLQEEGYRVDRCDRGNVAIEQGLAVPYDLVVLDWSLPGADGLRVLRHWRESGMTAPVIMLTARGGVDATVFALDSGADDYIEKPFSFEELLARIRAALRRQGSAADAVREVEIGRATLQLRARTVRRDDAEVELSSREFALLDYFLKHRGEVVSRNRILDRVWGVDHDTTTNVVDVYVRYLRSKLDPAATPVAQSVIETVRGRGYRLRPEEELVT